MRESLQRAVSSKLAEIQGAYQSKADLQRHSIEELVVKEKGKMEEKGREDPQTLAFCEVISHTMGLSSVSNAAQMDGVPELVESLYVLFSEMQKEVKEVEGVKEDVKKLTDDFVNLVTIAKATASGLINHLQNVKGQIGVISDALRDPKEKRVRKGTKRRNEESLQCALIILLDIIEAMQVVKSGSERLNKFYQEVVPRCQGIAERSNTFSDLVKEKLEIVDGRIKFGNKICT